MLTKAITLILIAAFAGLFLLKSPGGEPILSFDDLKPEVPQIKAGESPSRPTQVYRWQDENGIWQFSNQPQDESHGETIELDGNINLMPALHVPALNKDPVATRATGISIPSGFTTVSSDQVEEMMESVNNLQDTVDSRKADIDRLSSGKP